MRLRGHPEHVFGTPQRMLGHRGWWATADGGLRQMVAYSRVTGLTMSA